MKAGWCALVVAAVVPSCGAPARTPAPPGATGAGPPRATETAPICGALVAWPTQEEPDGTLLLVPHGLARSEVARYRVDNRSRFWAPLTLFAPWWFCVTDGEVTVPIAPAEPQRLGVIVVRAFDVDQSNAERGQE